MATILFNCPNCKKVTLATADKKYVMCWKCNKVMEGILIENGKIDIN